MRTILLMIAGLFAGIGFMPGTYYVFSGMSVVIAAIVLVYDAYSDWKYYREVKDIYENWEKRHGF